jgi:UDP-GlcNAc:undecaprenyl-phosphate GlcNAc-1-phosphate transferase
VLWLWTFVFAFSAASVVVVRLRYAALMLAVGLLAAAAITFSPGLRRFFGRVWRGMGAAAGPVRKLTAEGREETDSVDQEETHGK